MSGDFRVGKPSAAQIRTGLAPVDAYPETPLSSPPATGHDWSHSGYGPASPPATGTPGQAACETWQALRVGPAYKTSPWPLLSEEQRGHWEAAAEAAFRAARPNHAAILRDVQESEQEQREEARRLRAELVKAQDEIARLAAELADMTTAAGTYREGLAQAARERDEARQLLAEAADALWEISKAALTVKPSLDQPYPDAPDLTPWTRWMERRARQAHDVAMKIRQHLKASE